MATSDSSSFVCSNDSEQGSEEEVKLGSPFKNLPLFKDVELSNPFLPVAKRARMVSQSSSGSDSQFEIASPYNAHTSSSSSISETNSHSSLSDQDISSDQSTDSEHEDGDSNFSIELEEPFADHDVLDGLGIDYEDTSEKLFSNSNVTANQALAMLFSWFSLFPGISKEALSRLLFLLNKFLLPQPNNLPSSYQKAYALIKKSLVPVEEYDCCINDCIIFRSCSKGNYESLSVCPVCGEDRYQKHSKVSRKRFKYVPLAPRFSRLFRNKEMSKLIQNHQETSAATVVSDLHQTPTWKANYSTSGIFKGDSRGLSLALCTDGMNPFAKEKVAYSMWPVNLCLLNLPHRLRITSGSMLLTGIIPGRKEAKNLDPYIELLIDELKSINGSEVYDGYRCEKFCLQARIVLFVLDYPGQNKLFHCQGAGAYAGCVYCEHRGQYSSILQKIVYPGNRVFLPLDSVLRRNTANFPSKRVEHKLPPKVKTAEYIASAISDLNSADSASSKKKLTQVSGVKGAYALQALEDHNRIRDAPVDPMHLIKNIVEHVVKLLIGEEDSLKVRRQEQQLKRFSTAWLKQGETSLPAAPFTLTKEDIALASGRLMQIHVPSGFDWNNQSFFFKPSIMKSHQWKQVAVHGVLKYCLRGMLGNNQQRTLVRLFDILTKLCAEEVDMTTIDNLETGVQEVLVLVERDFPLSLQVIVFHLLHHLPKGICRFGPVYNYWMYPYERFNSWVTGRVLSRRFPESTVIETYRLSEWAHFMEASGQLPNGTALNYTKETDGLTTCTSREYHSSDIFQLSNEQLAQVKMAYSASTFNDVHLSAMASLSNVAQRLRFKIRTTQTGRKVIVNSAASDNDNSYTSNSYVSSTVGENVLVGRVLSLFEHKLSDSISTVFAYVFWFDGPHLDKKPNLYYVFCDSPMQSVVLFSSLSGPYVTAFDDQEPGKLWILNF